MKRERHGASVLEHFATGAAVVLLIAVTSWFLHEHRIMEHFEMANLDVFFLSLSKPVDAGTIAVVPITDDDYKELFKGKSPLEPAVVTQLIMACAVAGAKIIAVDLDTSEWKINEREKAEQAVADASPKHSARLVWAVGGWVNADGKPELEPLAGVESPSCEGVPASIPDTDGVVRGYLTTIGTQPNMALAINSLAKHPSSRCFSAVSQPAVGQMHYINYAGGGASFPHPSAKTVINDAGTEAWRNYNWLQNRIVIIGGSYRAGRDKYFTPAGYMDGVDILALTVLSLENGIRAPTARVFFTTDVLLGFALLTVTWFFHRTWVVLVSFLLIPAIALLTSFAAFRTFGYFFSFVPIVSGVFFHHLVEHALEHRRLRREVGELRQKVINQARAHAPPL